MQNFNFGLDNAESLAESKSKGQYPKFYDKAIEDEIIESLKPSYIAGLTLLGGEPFMNTNITVRLTERVRKEFGNTKNIWSWTGYEWEELQEMLATDFPLAKQQAKLLSLIDVLVDGRYVDAIRQQDLKDNPDGIHFRGSSNQRIIDVQKSLSTGKIVELNYLYEDEKIVPRDRDFKKM